MEALKKSVFSFIMINIVKKGIQHFLVNMGAQLEGRGGGGGGWMARSPLRFQENWKNIPWFWEKVSLLWSSII